MFVSSKISLFVSCKSKFWFVIASRLVVWISFASFISSFVFELNVTCGGSVSELLLGEKLLDLSGMSVSTKKVY